MVKQRVRTFVVATASLVLTACFTAPSPVQLADVFAPTGAVAATQTDVPRPAESAYDDSIASPARLPVADAVAPRMHEPKVAEAADSGIAAVGSGSVEQVVVDSLHLPIPPDPPADRQPGPAAEAVQESKQPSVSPGLEAREPGLPVPNPPTSDQSTAQPLSSTAAHVEAEALPPAADTAAVPSGPQVPTVPPGLSGLTVRTAAAVEPVEPVLRVSAAEGEEAVVRLDGENWIYLGSERDDEIVSPSVTYRRRRMLDGVTEIVVRGDQSGSYRLKFQRQDLTTGVSEQAVVAFEVAVRQSAAERASTTEIAPYAPLEQEGSDLSDQVTANVPTDRLPEGGIPIALTTSDEIADAARRAMDSNNRDLAEALWRRNRDLETIDGTEARRGLFDLSVSGSRLAEAAEHARWMLDHGEIPPVEPLMSLADHLAAAGNGGELVSVLERMAAGLSGAGGSDEVLFRLARHFESDPADRNLRRSLSLYRQITSDYPLSRHWNASRARIEHLERHYFFVR